MLNAAIVLIILACLGFKKPPMKQFDHIKSHLTQLNFDISNEKPSEGILVVNKESEGIKNLVIGVIDPILIMEQFIFNMPNDDTSTFKQLLMKNRDIIHGAFVLDESGSRVIFRDTLQLENLDMNELEASINSLSLLLSEYTDQIINFSKK